MALARFYIVLSRSRTGMEGVWYPLVMDRDISDELTGRMQIVPHSTVVGVDCGGCIIAVVEGNNVELRCNECAAVVGVVQLDILNGLVGSGVRRAATCPHCGKENTFPGFATASAYVCDGCGKAAEMSGGLERVEIRHDTCKWYEFEHAEPVRLLSGPGRGGVGSGFCGRWSHSTCDINN